MRMRNSRITAVAIGAAVLVGASSFGAVAAKLVTSEDIKNQTIRSVDIGAGEVGRSELADNAVTGRQVKDGSLYAKAFSDTALEALKGNTGAQGPKGDTGAQGPKGETGADADMSVVNGLAARVEALEAAMANGSDLNTNWVDGLGATIVNANTVLLDSRSDDGYSFATIKNLDLPIQKGAVIEFTYRLANGAAAGWEHPASRSAWAA